MFKGTDLGWVSLVAWVGVIGGGELASYNFAGGAARFSYAVGGQIEFTNLVEGL